MNTYNNDRQTNCICLSSFIIGLKKVEGLLYGILSLSSLAIPDFKTSTV